MDRARWLPVLAPSLLAVLTGASLPSAADPLDLDDPRPRWVEVRFESSPADQPDRLHGAFGLGLPAWLEPGPLPGQVTIAVLAREVEERLFADQRVRPGSFGDFVWVFDVPSGHVLRATLNGVVVRTLDWGFVRSDADVEIRVELGTLEPVGYAAPRRRLGHTVIAACPPGEEGCTAVAPAPLDPSTGYVNAVGSILARAFRVRAASFSPLGEAIFSELPLPGSVAFAPGSAAEPAKARIGASP